MISSLHSVCLRLPIQLSSPKMRSIDTLLMTTPMLSAPRKKAPKPRLIMCSRYLPEVSTLFVVACRPMISRCLSVLVNRSLTYLSSGKWKRTSSTKQSSRVRKLTHTQHRATQFATQRYTTQRSIAQHSTAPHRTAPHRTAPHRTAQHSIVQHNTKQYHTNKIKAPPNQIQHDTTHQLPI